MTSSESTSSTNDRDAQASDIHAQASPGRWTALSQSHPVLVGTLLAGASALLYTATNIALRQSARPNDFDWSIWVTANKGFVTAIVSLTLCTIASFKGRPGFPPLRMVPVLLGVGAVSQYFGNLSFQYGLATGGLALTLPLLFATLITSAALLGRIVLGEPLTGRLIVAMAIMIVAVAVLSQGASSAAASVTGDPASMFKAIVAGCLAGFGFGGVGVIIRKSRRENLSVAATLVCISCMGVVSLTLLSMWRVGLDKMLATTPQEFGWLMMASTCNAMAFFAVAGAYGLLPVTKVNLINTSQAAMGAVAGVLFFGEALTPWLIAGTALTLVGLVVSAKPGRDDKLATATK